MPYPPHPNRLARLPPARLATFASALDPPGSRVVGVWLRDGCFETVLELPAKAPRFEVA